jgi:hypothetical protein
MPKTLTSLLCSALIFAGCGGGGAQIGGTVSGLASGATVTLQNNGGDTLAVSANGSFKFLTDIDAGAAYNVTILSQPAGQTCTVANGQGSTDTAADDVNNVTVTCVSSASVTGTVSGLAPGTAVTLSDGTQVLPVAANGAFAFPGVLAPGTSYTVTVTTQPVGHTCSVANGTGTVGATTQVPIQVTCV